MPEEDHAFTPAQQLMTAEEIESLASSFVKLGVKKIRLTGGEPLVRKDAADIIKRLSKFPVKLTITTNGTRLHEFADLFEETGIRSVNISLDSLQEDKFKIITRRDLFHTVMGNIQMLIDRGFHVKINVVVVKGINEREINDFIAWTKEEPIHVRFIEYMPFTGNQWNSDKVFTWQQMLETAGRDYSFLPLSPEPNDTSKSYLVPGHKGTFAVISTMTGPFCGTCNRLRLTANGKMKNCLFSEHETDLLTPLREGREVEELIIENIRSKAKELGGQLKPNFEELNSNEIVNRSMISIGG
jgi:cyclic pyranopterin phosphate synthase